MSNPNILMVTSITSQFDVHMPQLTSNFGKCTISNCSFKYLACLALIQLDQADYTVVWDTRHPYFYSFQCCHLQLLVISFTSAQMFQIKQDPSIPEIQLFRYLSLNIQGQNHWWDQRSSSYCVANIISISFHAKQTTPSWDTWPWKSKVKVIDRSKVKVI